jgi:hypothetical protein
MKIGHPASFGRNSRAKVVLPAPLGPAIDDNLLFAHTLTSIATAMRLIATLFLLTRTPGSAPHRFPRHIPKLRRRLGRCFHSCRCLQASGRRWHRERQVFVVHDNSAICPSNSTRSLLYNCSLCDSKGLNLLLTDNMNFLLFLHAEKVISTDINLISLFP